MCCPLQKAERGDEQVPAVAFTRCERKKHAQGEGAQCSPPAKQSTLQQPAGISQVRQLSNVFLGSTQVW